MHVADQLYEINLECARVDVWVLVGYLLSPIPTRMPPSITTAPLQYNESARQCERFGAFKAHRALTRAARFATIAGV